MEFIYNSCLLYIAVGSLSKRNNKLNASRLLDWLQSNLFKLLTYFVWLLLHNNVNTIAMTLPSDYSIVLLSIIIAEITRNRNCLYPRVILSNSAQRFDTRHTETMTLHKKHIPYQWNQIIFICKEKLCFSIPTMRGFFQKD